MKKTDHLALKAWKISKQSDIFFSNEYLILQICMIISHRIVKPGFKLKIKKNIFFYKRAVDCHALDTWGKIYHIYSLVRKRVWGAFDAE